MKLENIANNYEDSNDKVESLMEEVISNNTGSFADKYSPVKNLVSSLSYGERLILVNKVRDMYEEDRNTVHAALGFTLYGNLNELSEKVKEQLNSKEDSMRGMAIHTIRKLNKKDCYDNLYKLLKSEKNLKSNVLVALSKLDFDKTLPELEDYLLSIDRDSAWFVSYNVLYDLINDKEQEKQEKINEILTKRDDGDLLLKNSYDEATRMIEEKDD